MSCWNTSYWRMSFGRINLIRQTTTDVAGFGLAHRPDGAPCAEKSVWELLHLGEKRHYQQLTFIRQKRAYLLGRVAAKRAIQALAPQVAPSDIFIDAGVFGFPVVRSRFLENMQVSISHTDEFGLALAYPEAHPLGIDTERVDTERVASVASTLDEQEELLLRGLLLPRPVSLTLLWTAKESLTKVLRTGLTLDLKLAAVKSLAKADNVWVGHFGNFGQYKSLSLLFSNRVCSVVLPEKTSVDLAPLLKVLEAL